MMKRFLLLLFLLLPTLFLSAENLPDISTENTSKWISSTGCYNHNYYEAQEIARKATLKAYEMGYLRYMIRRDRFDWVDWYDRQTYSSFRRGFNHVLDPDLERYSENWDQIVPILQTAYQSVTDWLMTEYNLCLQKHGEYNRACSQYQRALIYLDRGDTWSALNDMYAVAKFGEGSSEMQLALGQAYNDANQFLQAIRILSDLIEKDPGNKEAYFERANAYFEVGDFSKSMDDYLASAMRPTLISKNDLKYKHLNFSLGITTGVLKGGSTSLSNFAPTLLSTVRGLGTGLWAFASNPIGISKEFVQDAYEILQFIKANATLEVIANLIPELRECLEQWETLDDQTKGYYLGYVLGHYGVDCLIWKGSLQAVKAFQGLKRANAALIFETASLSHPQAKEILENGRKFWKAREEFKAKCYLQIDKQNKHIRGKHNFEPGGSEITVSVEKLETLAQKKLGEGIPEKGLHLGELEYKEIVDFGEEIGIVISKKGDSLGATTWGKIHYAKNGGYHIVPTLPPGK